MILKYHYRCHGQSRVVYFSGWLNIGKVNHPHTPWLQYAKILSKTEAKKEAPVFGDFCNSFFGTGHVQIVKNARAHRAGWRG